MDFFDEYIDGFSSRQQDYLREMLRIVRHSASEASESLSWGIPTFSLNGNLVHFGMYEKHLGFYPSPSGIEHFKDELKPYHTSKGTVRFPLDKPLPEALIQEIVSYRVAENLGK